MRRAIAALSILTFASLYPAPSFAFQNEVDRVFYNTCGANRHVVGEIYTDCTGHTVSWGQVTNYEERDTTTGCDGPTFTTYWECGHQVSSLDVCIC
jgi:hypothetical protein